MPLPAEGLPKLLLGLWAGVVTLLIEVTLTTIGELPPDAAMVVAPL